MDSVAGRANPFVLLAASVACTAAIHALWPVAVGAAEGEIARPESATGFPIASDARLAGDDTRTRFVLDLDKNLQFRAFALADPDRVVVDLPQVTFKLAPGAGATGRG